MDFNRDDITSQDETGEAAPIDQVEKRVEAEMKKIEGDAKRNVADGLDDPDLAREGERLKEQGERELKQSKP